MVIFSNFFLLCELRLTSSGLLVETSAWNATPAAKRQKISECDIMLICVSKHSLKDSEQAMELQYLVTESKHAAISAMCTQYNYLSNMHTLLMGIYAHWINTVEPHYTEHQFLEHNSYFEVHWKSQLYSWTSLAGILDYFDCLFKVWENVVWLYIFMNECIMEGFKKICRHFEINTARSWC